MPVRFTRIAAAIASAASITVLAAPAFAQTGTLGRGMDEIVRLYESSNPKLIAALKQHITADGDEVLVNIHLKAGVSAADALPALRAEGFRLQAVSALNPA